MNQTSLVNRPKSLVLAGKIADKFYEDLRHAREEGKKIAWVSHFSAIPIFRAMDIAYFFGDPFAATCAARHMEQKPQQFSEKEGMLPEVCSYSRTTLGTLFWPAKDKAGEDPYYQIPRPDFLINNDPGCHMLVWEYTAAAHHMGLSPDNYFYMQAPFIWKWSKEAEEEVIQEQVRQYKELIAFLEYQTGKKLDWDRFREVMKKVKDAITLRMEAMNMAAGAVPAPYSIYDWAAALAGCTYAAGTDEGTEFFRAVRDEVADRVAHKIGVSPNEKVRLLWEGHAFWPHLRFYSETLAKNDAVMVGGKYTHIGFYHRPDDIDPNDPLPGLAANSLLAFCYNLDWYADTLADICKKWKIDAIVGHFTRTCRIMCGYHFEIADIISRRLGIPTIYVESDVADPRFLSQEQTVLRLQALIETIKVRKGLK